MATILYGICGEGMGHAIRSKVVIKHLIKKGHEVHIFTNGKAFLHLSKHFNDVYEIHGLHYVFEKNSIKRLKTILHNIYKLPKGSYYSLQKLIKTVQKIKPNIIISDFEPFSSIVSKLFKIPLISLDNCTISICCSNLDIPKRYLHDTALAKILIKSISGGAKFYLIPTFFYPKVKNKNKIFLFPPIIRKEILNSKIKQKKHILVYHIPTSKMHSVIKEVNEKFIVYGLDVNKKAKNIQYKKFSEKDFIKDLAECKAAIMNGGFNLIGEALYLGKPILSIPIAKQFEQVLNALYVQRLGYGECHKSLNKRTIKKFISSLGKYRKNLNKYKREDNNRILKKLDSLIEESTK